MEKKPPILSLEHLYRMQPATGNLNLEHFFPLVVVTDTLLQIRDFYFFRAERSIRTIPCLYSAVFHSCNFVLSPSLVFGEITLRAGIGIQRDLDVLEK